MFKRVSFPVILILTAIGTLGGRAGAREGANAWEFREAALADRTSLSYAIIKPESFDPQRTYPVLVAFPPGEQDRVNVEKGLEMYWSAEAVKRGWVVISPVSAPGSGVMGGSVRLVPELLDQLSAQIKMEEGKVYVAGVSSGGRSALRFAGEHPKRCAAVMTLPGRVDDEQAVMRLDRLKDIPLRMFVGEKDERWKETSERIVKRITTIGGDAHLFVLKDQDHVLGEPLNGAVLFDVLEGLRPGRVLDDAAIEKRLIPIPPESKAIGAVLDDFHDAAAKADGERYFRHFAPNAVFYGTDATERWSVDEFKAYAQPIFAKGKGWDYKPTERHVFVSEDRKTAWFDERLYAEHMGDCRGSGVLTLMDGEWKIEQYNLTIPVPNDLAKSFVQQIREHAKKATEGKSN